MFVTLANLKEGEAKTQNRLYVVGQTGRTKHSLLFGVEEIRIFIIIATWYSLIICKPYPGLL